MASSADGGRPDVGWDDRVSGAAERLRAVKGEDAPAAETEAPAEPQAEAAEETPTEAPTEPEPETPAETPEEPDAAARKLQDQHRALSRRETKIARRDREVAQREAAVKAQEQQLADIMGRLRSDSIGDVWREVAKARRVDPAVALRELVADLSGQPKAPVDPEVARLRAELEELRGGRRQEAEAQSQAAQQAAVAQWTREVEAMADTEAYPHLGLVDGIGAKAFDVASRYYQKTGEEPSQADVLQYLEDQARARFERVSRRSQPQSPPPAKPVQPAQAAAKPRTVTNAAAARPASRVTHSELTYDDRLARATAALRALNR